MIYLILCIFSSTGIFLIFKFLDHFKVPSFPVIVINYLIASAMGFVLTDADLALRELIKLSYLPMAILIGFLFIVMFFVIAKSSAEAGLSITTVASKMSVVFPITFSIFIEVNDQLTLLKALAIMATLIGVYLTVYQPTSNNNGQTKMLIPLLLFLGMGIVDSLVKFAQFKFVGPGEAALFSAVLFLMAFLTGLVILVFQRKQIIHFKNVKTWYWGIGLGIVNFGSIFLLVSALNHINQAGEKLDSSIIFGANNIGIVTLSVLGGLLIFKEKLRLTNWVGIGISALAIILFSLA